MLQLPYHIQKQAKVDAFSIIKNYILKKSKYRWSIDVIFFRTNLIQDLDRPRSKAPTKIFWMLPLLHTQMALAVNRGVACIQGTSQHDTYSAPPSAMGFYKSYTQINNNGGFLPHFRCCLYLFLAMRSKR